MAVASLLSIVLSVMSLVSFLLGGALAGIGIWILSNKDKLRSLLNILDTSKLPDVNKHKAEVEAMLDKYDAISSIGIVILIVGGFIAAISICGGVGAMCRIKILLMVYIVVTGVLFVALLVGLIYFGSLKARMASQMQKKLTELQDKYLISVVSMIKNPDSVRAVVTVTINFMHIMLKCCGVNSIGDARNSTSWLESERRLTQLSKGGVTFGMPSKDQEVQQQKLRASGDYASGRLVLAQEPATTTSSMGEAAGKNIPDWLKPLVPTSFKELPAGVTVPSRLPPGFELPKDFKTNLAEIIAKRLTADNLNKAFDEALTIRTPITCCELSQVDDLLKGGYDVKKIYGNMKEMSCAFSPTNVGVNQRTCHQAFLDYISKYQHIVITVGIILACVMGGGVFAALWILCDSAGD